MLLYCPPCIIFMQAVSMNSVSFIAVLAAELYLCFYRMGDNCSLLFQPTKFEGDDWVGSCIGRICWLRNGVFITVFCQV